MHLTLTASCFSHPLHTKLQLLGDFQAQNAALAAFAVKTVLPAIDDTCIENGLAAAKLPGRFEILSPLPAYSAIPAIVLDGAHTVNSVSFTLNTFQTVFGQQEAHLLFACAADKDMLGMARLCNSAEHGLQNRFSHITLTKPGNTKQSNLPALCHAFATADLQYTCNEDFVTAINHALETAEKARACLLVMGSFYLLAEVKKLLLVHS